MAVIVPEFYIKDVINAWHPSDQTEQNSLFTFFDSSLKTSNKGV